MKQLCTAQDSQGTSMQVGEMWMLRLIQREGVSEVMKILISY